MRYLELDSGVERLGRWISRWLGDVNQERGTHRWRVRTELNWFTSDSRLMCPSASMQARLGISVPLLRMEDFGSCSVEDQPCHCLQWQHWRPEGAPDCTSQGFPRLVSGVLLSSG